VGEGAIFSNDSGNKRFSPSPMAKDRKKRLFLRDIDEVREGARDSRVKTRWLLDERVG
jgi:hypothetical protein